MERFWSKVERTADDGCWLWQAGRSGPYGWFGITSRPRHGELAHRFAWALTNGAVPEGMFVLHRCDVPLCVRPDHLFLGTAADNAADRDAKGRHWTPRGERSPHSRLTDEEVRTIRALLAKGQSQRVVASTFGISQPTISAIATGKRWSHVR